MRSYHTGAPVARPARKLHPKTQFTVQGDELRRTIDDNARLLVHAPVLSLGVPITVLLEAERRGVNWVVLIDENGRKYCAPISAFWQSFSFEVDRQFGAQRALPLANMTGNADPEPAIQRGLFDGGTA